MLPVIAVPSSEVKNLGALGHRFSPLRVECLEAERDSGIVSSQWITSTWINVDSNLFSLSYFFNDSQSHAKMKVCCGGCDD